MAAPYKHVALLYYHLQCQHHNNNKKPYTKKVGLILLVKPTSKANLRHQLLLHQPMMFDQRSSNAVLMEFNLGVALTQQTTSLPLPKKRLLYNGSYQWIGMVCHQGLKL